jgi:hypothetical protein
MDTILGLLGLAVYIVLVVGLASLVTATVIKISPAQSSRQRAKTDS